MLKFLWVSKLPLNKTDTAEWFAQAEAAKRNKYNGLAVN